MSAYLTAHEAVAYLKLPSVVALRSFLYRRRKAGFPVKTHRLGRSLRFTQADLDAALQTEQPRRLLRRVSA